MLGAKFEVGDFGGPARYATVQFRVFGNQRTPAIPALLALGWALSIEGSKLRVAVRF